MFKRFLTSLVILCVCVSLLSGCGRSELTVDYVKQNTAAVMWDCIDYEELFGIPDADVSDISAARMVLSTDLSKIIGDETIKNMMLDVASDEFNGRTSIDFSADIMDVIMDISVYADAEQLVIGSDSFLGGKYGIKLEDFDTMLDKFDSSELAKALGMTEGALRTLCEDNGIDAAYVDGVIEAYGDYVDTVEALNDTITPQRTAELINPYFGEITEETVDGKKCIAVEFNITNQLLKDIVALYMELYTSSMEAQENFQASIFPEEVKEEMMTELRKANDETLKMFNESLEGFFADFEINGKEKSYIDAATHLCVKNDGNLTVTTQDGTFNVEYTGTYDDKLVVSGKVTNPDGETADFTVTVSATEATEGVRVWEAGILTDDGKESHNYGITLTAQGGTYSLSLNSDGEVNASVDGEYSIGEDNFKVSLDSVSAEGETLNLGIDIDYTVLDEVTPVTDYKDLLSLTSDEAYALIGRITAASTQLMQQMAPAFEESTVEYPYYDDEYDFYDTYEYDSDYEYSDIEDYMDSEDWQNAIADYEDVFTSDEWQEYLDSGEFDADMAEFEQALGDMDLSAFTE